MAVISYVRSTIVAALAVGLGGCFVDPTDGSSGDDSAGGSEGGDGADDDGDGPGGTGSNEGGDGPGNTPGDDGGDDDPGDGGPGDGGPDDGGPDDGGPDDGGPDDGGPDDGGPDDDGQDDGVPDDGAGDSSDVDDGGDGPDTNGGSIEITLSGCDVDFSGDIVVSYNGSLGVASVTAGGGALTGSLQFDLAGPDIFMLSTQHRIDTGTVINMVDIGQGTWTNLDSDSLSGAPDSIGGMLDVSVWAPAEGSAVIDFAGVSLLNVVNGNVCTIDGTVVAEQLYP